MKKDDVPGAQPGFDVEAGWFYNNMEYTAVE
jgi:hypothetical protein